MKHFIITFIFALLSLSISAQDFDPNKNTITVTVAFAPGSPGDLAGRIFADYLNKRGYNAVVQNRPGAGGTLAANWLSTQPGNNHALMIATKSVWYPPIAGTETVTYNENSFVPIGLVGQAWPALALSSQIKSLSLPQLLEEYKQNSQRINFGTFGGLTELYIRQLIEPTGIQPNIVFYRSSAQLLADVMNGSVQVGLLDYNSTKQLADSGKLGLISGNQLPASVNFWWGLYAAPKASAKAAEWYSSMLTAMHTDPESQVALAKVFNVHRATSLAEFTQFHRNEVNHIRRLHGDAKTFGNR